MENTSTTLYKSLLLNYGNKSNGEISQFLTKVSIIKKGKKLNNETIQKLSKDPRSTSITWFEDKCYEPNPIRTEEVMRIPFLVKSTSHMLVKPDIGEIVDQLGEVDLKNIDALEVGNLLEKHLGKRQDEFIMEVILSKIC